MNKPAYYAGWFLVALLGAFSFRTIPDEPLSPVRTPDEERATFQLESGLEIQLVAAEPTVEAPVVTTFDADGRLWVVEMRGFMNTVDGAGEDKPVGRVVVLEDTDGDGRMDERTVYLDSLLMPRALAIVGKRVLVVENNALWQTEDRNGDLKADTKTLIDKEYAGQGLPEHAGNGLWRSMDNWYYNAKSRFRYRLTGDTWQRDSTEFRGQWGISHDDYGHLYYNYNWSQLHADLVPPNTLSRNRHHKPTTGIDHGLTIDRRVYPIRSTPAVNRGYIPGTLSQAGRLQEFTAACSPLVYRETVLPDAYRGNAFVCEPAGNLIKRNAVTQQDLLLTATDPHPGREFLASTDERFRPVHLTTGPDGALYVTDMYRGLIQHAAYLTPYLKEQTLARHLLEPVNRGRIWRIVPTGWKPSKPKKLTNLTSAELVDYLKSPNGWHRDMAQQLLVDRNDRKADNALTDLAATGPNALSRFHALWTLDGLHRSDPTLLLRLAADPDPLVQGTALRLLEPLARTNASVRTQLGEVMQRNAANASIGQSLQLALTAQVLESSAAQSVLAGMVQRYGTSPLMRDAVMSSLQDREYAFLNRLMQDPAWQTQQPDREIFLEMLTTAIVRARKPTELTALLNRLDPKNATLNWQEKAILTGLTIQAGSGKQPPIMLAAAPAVLLRSGASIDERRRQALASLFDWPGHVAERLASTKKSLLGEDDQKLFATGRQQYLTTCAGCHGTDGAGLNRFAPPLIGSDWVLGDEKRLALILLHGMEGPVDVAGKVYNAPDILPVMPAHSTLDDGALTAILTYIRNEWGNSAGPMGKRTVSTTRVMSQGRVVPWTAKELNSYVLKTRTEILKQTP